jgi:hypothetical protein
MFTFGVLTNLLFNTYPMPTQNFLSTDFFLLSSEEEAKRVLLSLPTFHPNISLLRENSLVHTTRFLFENTEKQLQHYIDVSLLPLNDQHVLVRLHGSYTNGKSFNSDPDLSLALKQFEYALCNLLKKDDSVAGQTHRSLTTDKKNSFFTNAFFSLFPRSI